MAWFGSGISQITGQISNFTKEVLTEGTEEVDDHVTELRLTKSRISEMESYCETRRAEGQKLEHVNKEMAEKLEAAELQISTVSAQYRENLAQKEEEIRELKAQLNALQHVEPQMMDTSILSAGSVAPSTHSGFGHGDEHDFDDLVTSQHEINLLRSKVQHLQAECRRWQQVQTRQAAEDPQSQSENGEDKDTLVSLQSQVKDLQQQLSNCVDQNQHELATLQDLHSQKLGAVAKRQKDEAQAHEEKVTDLIEQLRACESGNSSRCHDNKLSSPREQVEHLEEINRKISTDLEQMHAADREKGRLLTTVREELRLLEEDHDKVKEDNTDLSSQHALLLAELDALVEERQMLKTTIHELSDVSEHVHSIGEVTSQSHDHDLSQSRAKELEQQVQALTGELDTCRQEMDEFDLVKSDWTMEKEALEEVLLTLREQLTRKASEEDVQKEGVMKDDDVLEKLEMEKLNVARLEKELQHEAESRSELEGVRRELDTSRRDAESAKLQLHEKCAETSDLERRLDEKERAIEESNANISRLSTQIETAELAMRDDLEGEVDDLRRQVKEKNERLMDANVEFEEMKIVVEKQVLQVDALNVRLSDKSMELEKVEAEKELLSTSVDELDSQHEEAMSHIIASRQSLLAENVELRARCTALESEPETRQTSVKCGSDDEVNELKAKVEKAAMSLNELHMDKKELEDKTNSLKRDGAELRKKLKTETTETTSLKRKIHELEIDATMAREELCLLKQSTIARDDLGQLRKQFEDSWNENARKEHATELHGEIGMLKADLAAALAEKDAVAKQLEEATKNRGGWELAGELQLQARFDSLQDQNESLEKLLSDTEERLTEIKQVYDAQIGMLNADIAAALAEKDNVAEQLEEATQNRGGGQLAGELQACVDSLQNQNESLEKLLSDTEERLTEIRQVYDAEIVTSEGRAAQAKRLNEMVNGLSHENAALAKQLTEGKEELLQEARRFEQEKCTTQNLGAQICVLETKCVDLERNKVMLDESVSEKRQILQAWEESKGFIATLRVENEGLLRDKESGTTLIRQQRDEIKRLGLIVNEDPLGVGEDGSSEVIEDARQTMEVSPRSDMSDRTDRVNGGIAQCDVNAAELDNLRKIVSVNDSVVSELKASNASLLSLLEERSMELHGNRILVDLHELRAEVANRRREKEQMMSVLNEKTLDCSSLKSEVHRLMSVVSGQKAALSRIEDENTRLQNSPSFAEAPIMNSNDDMSRQAIKQLSQVIRDKDVEMEALRQKSDTLIAVLQVQSPDGAADQISTLMRERDNLAKQVGVYVDDRNQIVAALNNKHQECVAYHGEATRLAQLLTNSSAEKDKVEHEYEKLAWEFENKKKALLKAQNELVGLRQKCSESNQLYLDLKQSGVRLDSTNDVDSLTPDAPQDAQQLIVVLENQRAAVCEKDEIIAKNTTALRENEQGLRERDQRLLERDRTLSEREKSINELRIQLHRIEEVACQKEAQLSSANKANQHSTFQLQGLQTEAAELQSKCSELSERNDTLQLEMNNLRETHGRVSRAIGDKEFELAAAHEKINTLSQLVAHNAPPGGAGSDAEAETAAREKAAVQQQVAALRRERDQLVAALQQQIVENEQFHAKISQMSEREQKLSRELDRLRGHLLAIEENYTREALDSEEREKDLRNSLAQAEERLLSSSSLVESASQQANHQVETLQQQLRAIAEQRDNAIMQLANAQEMASQYANSLTNLQMVLEQFQHERNIQQAADMERCQKELKVNDKERCQLKQQLDYMKEQLEEKSEALEAASRLSEQLDRKEEMISALREEVQLREKDLMAAEETVTALSGTREAKVDKALVKNLLIGYFHTPTAKRVEVLKLMCKVLDFNAEETQQIGAETSNGWFGGLLRRVTPATPTSSKKSFSELFVNFLETESTPKLLLRLPAEAMAEEQQKRHEQRQQKHSFNPFTATATPTGRRSSGEDSHLLMKPIAASLPIFTPIVAPADSASRGSSGRSTPASSTAILRDVLQQ